MPGLLVHLVYCPDAQLQELDSPKGSSLIKHQHLITSKAFFQYSQDFKQTHGSADHLYNTQTKLPNLEDTHWKYKTGFGFCC